MDASTFLNPREVLQQSKLHEGLHVADFGAGSGFFTRAAAHEVGDAGVVWAVDVHQDLLPRIKNLAHAEGLHNVEVVHGDVSEAGGSNLPAESFDFCIVANLLFVVEDKPGVVTEVRRVLKRGGRALVVDWSDSFGGLGPHKDHIVGAGVAKKLFENHGLVFVEDIRAGEYHWGFIVRKKT